MFDGNNSLIPAITPALTSSEPAGEIEGSHHSKIIVVESGDVMDYSEAKQMVYRTAIRLNEVNLIRLSAGNISFRTQDGMVAITPSGIPYNVMVPEDIVIIDLEGNIVDAQEGRRPSSEYLLHTSILKHLPDVNSVIHTHSYYAITFATLNRELPPICIELLVTGGPIPVAPYALPGTVEVGEIAAGILLDRPELKGCLLKNHGMVSIGTSLKEAFAYALDIETGARIYHQAIQIGEPEAIPQEDIDAIRQKYDLIADRKVK
jgi:ribulose-5-phosphate 4-epimerase/fuculose-1-phosphate aldolase